MAKVIRLLLLVGAFAPIQLLACPLCHSNTAEEVRTGIFQTALDGLTIPALVMPFVVLAMVVSAILVDWHELFIKSSKLIVNATGETT